MLKHLSLPLQSVVGKLGGDKKNSLLTLHWAKFMDKAQAENSTIDKITYDKASTKRVLTILATASHATELEYQADKIKNSINEFLGENYISKIRIRQGLHENTSPNSTFKPVKLLDSSHVETTNKIIFPDDLHHVEINDQLLASLNQLAKNLNQKN